MSRQEPRSGIANFTIDGQHLDLIPYFRTILPFFWELPPKHTKRMAERVVKSSHGYPTNSCFSSSFDREMLIFGIRLFSAYKYISGNYIHKTQLVTTIAHLNNHIGKMQAGNFNF